MGRLVFFSKGEKVGVKINRSIAVVIKDFEVIQQTLRNFMGFFNNIVLGLCTGLELRDIS